MFKDTRETDVVLGPVVAAGLEALKVCPSFIFQESLEVTYMTKLLLL